jgi:hypothetical protein
MARRARRRQGERLRAPVGEYRREGEQLVLRGSLTPATRAAYGRILAGEDMTAAANREDTWHRAFEFLFERLAVSWSIAGLEPITRQAQLLARLRAASPDERAWVRERLREHCAEHFPDVAAP